MRMERILTKPLVETAIQQLNLGYDAQQDRLLLKIGLSDDTEIAAWLTRKVVKILWVLLQQSGNMPVLVPNIPVANASVPLKQTAAADDPEQQPSESLNFAEEYRPGRKPRATQPLLAIDCQIITNNKKPTLELQTKEGNAVNMALSPELIYAFGNMLQLALRDAAWDLYLSSSPIIMSDIVAHPVLH